MKRRIIEFFKNIFNTKNGIELYMIGLYLIECMTHRTLYGFCPGLSAIWFDNPLIKKYYQDH